MVIQGTLDGQRTIQSFIIFIIQISYELKGYFLIEVFRLPGCFLGQTQDRRN